MKRFSGNLFLVSLLSVSLTGCFNIAARTPDGSAADPGDSPADYAHNHQPSPTPTPTPMSTATATPAPTPTSSSSACSSGSLSVDVADAAGHASAAVASLSTVGFSTRCANELLLAFIATDSPSGTSFSVSGVSGAGLTWERVAQTNSQGGDAEIWRAFASSPLSNAGVTASFPQSVAASIAVVSFSGVDTSGSNGSGAIGAIAQGSAASGAPSASLVTTRAGSWVYGVGNDWDSATARSVPSGQNLVDQYLASIGDTYWVQRQSQPTAASGTLVSINDTAPTADRYNLSLVEILPASGAGSATPAPTPTPTSSSTPAPTSTPTPTASADCTRYVSPGGSDSNSGASDTSAWKTLQHAADSVAPGDTVCVRAGTYVGFQLSTSGTATSRITFRADPGVLVNAKSAVTSAYAGAINLEGASYVTVDGFNITLATYGSVRANLRAVEDTGVIFRNNTIDNASWWGILTGNSHAILVENNHITNTQIQHGIYLGYGKSDGSIVRKNYVANSHDCGIQLNADNTDGGDGIITGALIEANTLINNAQAAGASINLNGVQSSIVRNNLAYGSRNGIALFQDGDASGGSINNLLVNNTVVMINGQGYYDISIIGGTAPSSGNTVLNNVLYHDASSYRGSITIDSASLAGFQSDYNVVVDMFNLDPANESQPVTFSQWQAQTGQDKHSILATPSQLFVNGSPTIGAYDFHLKAGSPAIDAGTSVNAPSTDLDGGSRPKGVGFDIGAYEY